MRANALRVMMCVLYVLCFFSLWCITSGCTKGEGAVSVQAKPTSVVEVATHRRGGGSGPGMDVVCVVKDKAMCVCGITITYKGEVSGDVYGDYRCDWYRLEDSYGMAWGGVPSGTAFTLTPPVYTQVLTKGTWVAHFTFLTEEVPTLASVALVERPLSEITK